MKAFLPFFLFVICFGTHPGFAQENYSVNGETLTLNTEVSGNLSLLWNIIDSEYRYFSKKGNEILELKNTQENLPDGKAGGDYLEEYKTALQQQTADVGMEIEDLKLTLPDLREFFNVYNEKKDPNFSAENKSVALNFRLGGFVGISNLVHTANPTNETVPIAGLELELTDADVLRRHALVFQFRQSFESSEYKFSSSQVSMNYRFKFIKTPKLDVFVNAKIVAFTHYELEVVATGPQPAVPVDRTDSGSSLEAPIAFGLGADYALGNGYLTFLYSDIVALGVDNNGEFPMDFALGYKFNL